ncbi:hypothetical protein PQX77_004320 [Marasmius sp. AFHP31]|nr:hypothetical protein PQX77_004320 [Marasmius sp. AFHP31]
MSNLEDSGLTTRTGTLSLTEDNIGKDSIENLEGELDFEGTLLLDYMLKNEPFEKLYEQYIPHKEFDHYPPEFEYGVALAKAELIEYALQHGLATDQLHAPRPDWSIVFRAVNRRLCDALNVKLEQGLLHWRLPLTKDKQRTLMVAVCSNYNRKIRVADPAALIKGLEREFKKPAMWYLSRPTCDDPGLRPHYKISGE